MNDKIASLLRMVKQNMTKSTTECFTDSAAIDTFLKEAIGVKKALAAINTPVP
jgi:hypothetical protein